MPFIADEDSRCRDCGQSQAGCCVMFDCHKNCNKERVELRSVRGH